MAQYEIYVGYEEDVRIFLNTVPTMNISESNKACNLGHEDYRRAYFKSSSA